MCSIFLTRQIIDLLFQDSEMISCRCFFYFFYCSVFFNFLNEYAVQKLINLSKNFIKGN